MLAGMLTAVLAENPFVLSFTSPTTGSQKYDCPCADPSILLRLLQFLKTYSMATS